MTITLPKGWGPGTILTVLYALAVIVGGTIEIAQGDMTLAEYVGSDAMKGLAAVIAGLSVARGVAYVGGDPNFAQQKDEGVSK